MRSINHIAFIIGLISFPFVSFGQFIDLGTADNFVLFSGSGAVSNSGASTLTGDIGTDGGAISGFATATVNGSFYIADAVTNQAKIDVIDAYNVLTSIPATSSSHAPAFGGGETLTTGVYSIAGAGSAAGVLTLDGLGDTCATFIFRFGGAFTVGASSSIVLTNGVQACNVFWVAEGATSIAASVTIKGTVLCNAGAVSIGAGCVMEGRLLTITGAIAFDSAISSIPTSCVFFCASYQADYVFSCCNPDFGGTINFVLFTSSGAVTNSGTSVFSGNIGSDLGVISGFAAPTTVAGSFYNADNVTAKTKNDLKYLYDQLITIPATYDAHAPAFGSGETLTKGVYDIAGAGSLGGTITLDAENDTNAVFIFRYGGAFAAGASSKVILVNQASSCSVFWVAEGAVSVGAGSVMKGTFIANNGAVAMTSNSEIDGRLFSTSGAITVDIIVADNTAPCQNQTFSTPTSTWNGSASTDWHNDANWSHGTPDLNVNVIIPSGPSNMPTISGAVGECRDLETKASGSLTLNSTNEINIYGDWTNNGTFNSNAGKITLKGSSSENKIRCMPNQRLADLTIDNVNGATLTSGSLELTGVLDVVSGDFNTNDSLTLISDIAGTARINELASKCRYTLEMHDSWSDNWNGGFITIFVDNVSIGDFSAKKSFTRESFYTSLGSTVQIEYTEGFFEEENSYLFYDQDGTVLYSDGPTPDTGFVYSVVSNYSFRSPIIGDITMQRYIGAGATDWRFLTSAIKGATLAQFNDDFVTSGFPGAHFPNWPTSANPWPSIYTYDETQAGEKNVGYMPATGSTNVISPGQGLQIYCGDNSVSTQSFTIDITGPPNTGTINLPLTYTNTGNTGDGWNIVANPYPSAIDWDSHYISKTNINNAVYIWSSDLQQFTSYAGGIGTNGGSNNIASSQAFWVQSNSVGATIQVTEAGKSAVDGTFIKQTSAVPLRIKTSNAYGSDELVINFNDFSSAGFDAIFDAEKIPSSNINLPLTSSVVNGTDCSINQLNYQERDIPIKILCGITGTHTIQIENALDFTPSSCLFLEDLFTGISYDLSAIDSFSTTIYDSTETARFLLHIGAPVIIDQTDANCFGNASGSIVFSKRSTSPFDITWKDNLNKIVAFNSNVNSTDSITKLVSGTYFIESTDAICANRIDTIVVTQPDEIITEFISDNDTVYLASGGTVNFTNQSVNGNSYLWDFGDFNSSALLSPQHQYSYAGVYNVTLNTYQSLLCSEEAAKEIVVLEQNTIEIDARITPSVWINNNDLIVTGRDLDKIEIRNAIGQLLVESKSLSNTTTSFNLGNLNSQVLFVSVFSKNKLFTSKVIFIRN